MRTFQVLYFIFIFNKVELLLFGSICSNADVRHSANQRLCSHTTDLEHCISLMDQSYTSVNPDGVRVDIDIRPSYETMICHETQIP